jgi:DNA-binding transcriptional LysR family regulator
MAFAAVAKFLNFTRAADSLNITQSALSQRIAKLEDELGTTLLVRDRSLIRLTDAGEQVLRYYQLNEGVESELLGRLKGSKDDLAGILRIGGFSSINRSLVIPSLKKMMTKNPKLSIQLITKEIQNLNSLLKSAEADYIFTNKKSDSENIESIFLGYEENVLVQLKKAPEVDIYLDHDETDPTTKSYFSQNKIPLKPSNIRYLDDVYGLIDGVKNGYGKAILPLHLIENESTLEIVDPKKTLKVSVYLHFFLQPFYRRLHTEFLNEVQAYFKTRLRQDK